jgi:ArsR family transcriptional regulator
MQSQRSSSVAGMSAAAGVLRLLADPTRLRILGLITIVNELNVTQLCEHLQCAQPMVSHHLGLLRVSRVVEARRDGKNVYYRLGSAATASAAEGLRLSFDGGTVTVRVW